MIAYDYFKFPGLRTVIAKLMAFRMRAQQRTWLSQTRCWLSMYFPQVVADGFDCTHVSEVIINGVHSQQRAKLIGTQRYLEAGMASSNKYLRLALRHNCTTGIHLLAKLRVGAYWGSHRLAMIGWLPEQYVNKCACCRQPVQETLDHLFRHCQAWTVERADCFDRVNLVDYDYIALLGGRDGDLRDPSGNQLYWLGPPEGSLDISQGDDTLTPERHTPVFIWVAEFLQRMWPRRLRLVARLKQVPRADAEHIGMAAPDESTSNGAFPLDVLLDDAYHG